MILGLPDEANLLSHAYMIDGDVDTDVECLQEYFLRLFGIEDIYQSVDVTVFDGSEVGVDEVRELVKNTVLQPYGNQKIYLFLHADKLSVSARNALLKTIEEPAKNTVFFLLTNNSYKLLPTILSRTVTLYHNNTIQESSEEKVWIDCFLSGVFERDLIALQHALDEISSDREKSVRYLECLTERMATLLKGSYSEKYKYFYRVELLALLASVQRAMKLIRANTGVTATLDTMLLNIMEGID